ncbi:MAG: hypothetical protein PVH19_04215 [Planctomycetia bacterium]|jgi:hypothetical protein
MSQYNLRTVFRQTSNSLLRKFFEKKGHRLEVEWEELKETQIDGVYEAFLALPDGVRRELDVNLKEVYAVAKSDDGPKALMERAAFLGLDIVGEWDLHKSRYDKAMYVLLHYPKVWEQAVALVFAQNLSSRYWYRCNGLPKHPPKVSEAALEELRQAMSAFYWQSQGRGEFCRIEHVQRNENQNYFFVYLSDHVRSVIAWDDGGQCHRTLQRNAFRVVFIFDRSMGILDLFAQGGKKMARPLQEIFAATILGMELEPEDESIPYSVDKLKNASFEFVTDPEDGISQVAVRMLRMVPRGNPDKKIMVKLPVKGQPEDIYVSLENDLNRESLPAALLVVERATIAMRLDGRGRKKVLRFDVGPKSCTLKSESEQFRLLGEKYLRRWKIDRSA